LFVVSGLVVLALVALALGIARWLTSPRDGHPERNGMAAVPPLGSDVAPNDRRTQTDATRRDQKEDPGDGDEGSRRTDAEERTAGKKGPPKGGRGPEEPEFDPNDLERTARWALDAMDGLRKEATNGIRYRAALQKLQEEVQGYGGKKVRWSLTVSQIFADPSSRGDYVYLSPEIPPRTPLHLQPGDPAAQLRLRVGTDISEATASRLEPKNKVSVTAEVIQVTVEGANNPPVFPRREGPYVRITVKDLRAVE
jgi:hypothetical protein